MEKTPMQVKIISGTNKEVEAETNEFLKTENLDVYNFIDNVTNDHITLTILHRIKPDMPEEELKEVVEAKLEKHAQAE